MRSESATEKPITEKTKVTSEEEAKNIAVEITGVNEAVDPTEPDAAKRKPVLPKVHSWH